METPITKESLIAYGFRETENVAMPLEKILSFDDQGEPTEGEGLLLCVSRYRNQDELSLLTPEGIIYLNIDSIESLRLFEQSIGSWESRF